MSNPLETTVSDSVTNAAAIAANNPLRYRGYVYDTETGLYYLQSRYYNPVIGRFINADSLIATGQGLLGNNMFAYCGNNPTNCSDPTGQIRQTFLGDNHIFSDWMLMGGTGGGGVSGVPGCGSTSSGTKSNVRKIGNPYNPFNDDEYVVLNAEHFAFYKGVLVFKADLPEGAALSFGIIVLDREEISNDMYGEHTLMHEYGHTLHMKQIGFLSYASTVAVPSIIGAYLSNRDLLSVDYYSLPWERIADYFGNVHRSRYEPWAGTTAYIYWIYTDIIDPRN